MKRYKYFHVWMSLAILAFTTATIGKGAEFEPGKERWIIKTTVPDGVDVEQGKKVAFANLVKMPNPKEVKRNDSRFDAARIPAFNNPLKMKSPPYVEVTGQLFYDNAHVVKDSETRRAKKPCGAAPVWELHPITNIKFAPEPNR
jgi:hypothetical protein